MKNKGFWLFIASLTLYWGVLAILGGTPLGRSLLYVDFIGRIVEGPVTEMCCLFTPLTAPISLGILFLVGVVLLRRLNAKR